ncbi:hypothetical protein CCM_03747 [Cordyceps militaris CM01]|uniref:Uncharacterized protein n=1 Tax=Cordyceps militaris (strain CM01) TaxID=983644 RepID=G3JGF7_CORMM|nr:uncharacterized protein CCM_03747 [Cordyceps militaris CM01]EGX92374.1 hypothetical protein CCM_03747 [Cordyceps militaris CM01]
MPKLSSRGKTLRPEDFKYYLNDIVNLGCYKAINRAGSTEDEVDAFYTGFLADVFLKKNGWVIHAQTRAGRTLVKIDVRVRWVRLQGAQTAVILWENKRRELESDSSVWAEALEQVVEYADAVRCNGPEQDASKPLYLTVNVGTYLRFYELPGLSNVAKDWAPAKGKLYELADDEEAVWKLWNRLRRDIGSAAGGKRHLEDERMKGWMAKLDADSVATRKETL